jgi:hypothetical protein
LTSGDKVEVACGPGQDSSQDTEAQK